MLDTILKNKKLIIIALAAVLIIMFFSGGGNSAEDVAKEFIEASLKGDADKVVSLMSDITIDESPYETKKLFTHAMEKTLKNSRERYKDKYGDSWKYKVKVIDSYDVDFSDIEEYVEITDFIFDSMRDVAITVEHKGSGWFNDKEGTEDMIIRCVKEGKKWYVLWGE